MTIEIDDFELIEKTEAEEEDKDDKTDYEFVEKPSEEKSALAQNCDINIFKMNIACLPSLPDLHIQINGKFLRPNHERATKLVDAIIDWNIKSANPESKGSSAPDIICFEEAWEASTRDLLRKKLKDYYPYETGTAGEGALGGSGLIIFSKYRIVETQFKRFYNEMIGEETIPGVHKGRLGVKLQLHPPCENNFITCIDTHTEAGGAIEKEKQSALGGTTSSRRGEQMGKIYEDIKTWATKPPPGTDLVHLKTFLTGDFNAPLNSERQRASITTGMSNNGYESGIKYPGQNLLFSLMEPIFPNNFQETRRIPDVKGQKKPIVPELVEKAKRENAYTGSTIPVEVLIQNKEAKKPITRQDAEHNVIDGIFITKEGVKASMEYEILTLGDEEKGGFAISDHRGMRAKCTLFANTRKPVASAGQSFLEGVFSSALRFIRGGG